MLMICKIFMYTNLKKSLLSNPTQIQHCERLQFLMLRSSIPQLFYPGSWNSMKQQYTDIFLRSKGDWKRIKF